MLAYLLIHTAAGPLGLLINLIVYVIIAVIVFLVIKWAAAEFGVPPKIVQLLGLLLFLLLILTLFVGCTSAEWQARKPAIAATEQYALSKAANIAAGIVLNGAVSLADGQAKGDVMQGLSYGLRTQEGSLLTSDDVSALVSIWTPSKPHWASLGADLATAYAKANPKTPAAASKALEAIATGLDSATTK